MNLARFRVVARDLENQGIINKEALEKSAAVIKKLNEDLQQALSAASTIQGDNQTLREDLEASRVQLREAQDRLQEAELAKEGQM